MTHVVEYREKCPNRKLSRCQHHEEVSDSMNPAGVLDFSKGRGVESDERQNQDNGEEQGDDVPESHNNYMGHHGPAILQGDIQHEIEILVHLVCTVEPSDADHLEDCNP